MNLLKIFTVVIALTYFFLPPSNPSQSITTIKSQLTININDNDSWVMEFHDDQWWWVLYNEDGAKIMEIPVEF